MNERIKELFKRAGGKTSIRNLMSNPVQHREYNELWDEHIEKFAELIQQECISVVLNSSLRPDDMAAIIAHHIRQHFGVKS